ncbi:MAG: helicase, partial [Chloroflexota bacterium]|nr:helicase [Chloroflexota bacterium]
MGQVIQPADVRSRLREALELDLIGPGAGQPLADERLPGWVRPSNWYLTGFLVPRGAPAEQRADADADDDFEPEVADEGGLGDDSTEDRRSAKKGFFPSSMGLSFLVAEGVDRLDVTIRWGDYRYVEDAYRDDGRTDDAPDGSESSDSTDGSADEGVSKSETTASTRWQRTAREETVPITLVAAGDPYQEPVPGSRGLILHMIARPVSAATSAGRIPPGTRSVSLFLVNGRPPAEDTARDEAFAFQAELEVRSAVPFVPRPDPRGATGDDSDERMADLHYADTPEFAAGHGVAAHWELADGACRVLRTTCVPAAEVETTATVEDPDVELAMAALGGLSDGGDAERALTPLVAGYRTWIDQQDAALTGLTGERRETAEELVFHARSAAARMERGIRVLSQDPDALDAFRVANRAVAAALLRRLAREGVTDPPRWRAFQLAFLLLNLSGLADPANPEREFVDLLFFPTGGGKTEAYLGLAAFAMVLRRLRNPEDRGRGGAGVSVIMRYTLRLLTLDQLGRAAGLVCALELERRKDVGRYGEWPFEIGLWVGKAGTPNRLGERGDSRSDSARSKVSQYKNN